MDNDGQRGREVKLEEKEKQHQRRKENRAVSLRYK